MLKNQSGFTLIELVMVIVILGVLAATALPKFVDLGSDARESSIKGAMGAVKSAAAIAHSASLVANSNSITMDGSAYTLVNGYPGVSDIKAIAGLSDDYTLTATGVASTTIALQANCQFKYTVANGVVDNLDVSGC